ncbi:hypothetical protein HUJ04_003074 [Dendroctonus ponderosae]|nr:hypothetical protein HUJ04_003074 [Dendroctonus ponderosae]KAH1023905.1 hypothetical protein HUJ05_003483 [Dendroctonus ponderosae]
MSNIQNQPEVRAQNADKFNTAMITVTPRHNTVATPIVDTVIRKIRISNNNCDMRPPKVNGDTAGKPTQHGTVINGPSCDNENMESALIADKYQLFEQVIGSSLYRCVDVNSKQELVCKIVSRDNHSLISAHYRMDSQPLIQSLHEVVVGQRYLYLVFPKAHGDLHSYVRQRKRLRESEARRLFRQIAETVRLCHENGIVLRDLKLRKFVFANPEK